MSNYYNESYFVYIYKIQLATLVTKGSELNRRYDNFNYILPPKSALLLLFSILYSYLITLCLQNLYLNLFVFIYLNNSYIYNILKKIHEFMITTCKYLLLLFILCLTIKLVN